MITNDWWRRCRSTIISHYYIPSPLKEAVIYHRASRLHDLRVPAESAGIIIAEEMCGCQLPKTSKTRHKLPKTIFIKQKLPE